MWASFVKKSKRRWTNIWQHSWMLKSKNLSLVVHLLLCRMISSSHENHFHSKRWKSSRNSKDSSWSWRNFKTRSQTSELLSQNMMFVEISFSIKVETSVLWLNTSWTVNCSLHMKKKSYLHWWIVSLNWIFFFDFSCWKKKSNWYCENEDKTWIWVVTEWNDFWSDILNIERNFLDILIKNVISIRIETFSKNDSNYLTKRVLNIKSSMRTYTTWMKKTIWWEWKTKWNKFLRFILI
jgi:hypothetical protein